MVPCEKVLSHEMHVCNITSGLKVMVKVKVFVHASHTDADPDEGH